MKHTALLSFTLFLLSASAAHLVADDWIPLFDGKSLDGWHQAGGKHKYEVVDGMIVGTSVAGEGNAFMTTDKTYQNFELKFEVKVDHRLNSGCQIRSVPVGKNRHLRGPQVEIAGGKSGFIYGEVMKKADGSPQKWISPNLKDEKTEPIQGAFKVNAWNAFLIRVVDDHYQTYINDVPITDFKFDGMPNAGHIGLQVHGVKHAELVGKRVRWKNIQLRPLKPARAPAQAPILAAAPAAAKKAKKTAKKTANAAPPAFPYLDTSKGREGYELAGEETNTHRMYDFYKRQARHHLKQDRDLALLPAYTDLDGGTFGHWGNYNKNGHKDLRWNDMDYGPALTASYSLDAKKKIGSMLTVRLPSGHTVTFNKNTGGYYNAWAGRPYFNPHRWGLIHGVAVPKGVRAADLRPWFAAAVQDGQTMSRYLGHYQFGKRVVTHYEIGKTRFLDHVSRMDNGCYARTISATRPGAVAFPFDLSGHKDWDITTAGDVLIAKQGAKAIVAAAKSFTNGEAALMAPDRASSRWTAPATADAFKLYFWEGAAAEADAVSSAIQADKKIDTLRAWTLGGEPAWPQRFRERVRHAENDKPYVVDRIGVPLQNPWGSMMMLSGIDFDPDGVGYVTTLMGDVWKVTGLGKDTEEVTWRRFATGLNQPFGVRVLDGLPYVLTRGSIVCLKDLNADGEADYYHDHFNGFSHAPTAHTRSFGFHADKDKTFYFVLGNAAYKKPWNRPLELLGSGLRNAMAAGASRDGLFLVGPQEGTWTPASAVLEMRRGDFFGSGVRLSASGKRAKDASDDITPAMAYLPRGIDNSTGGFEFPESDRFGPLSGKILGLSYGYGSWFRVVRNDGYADYGRAQGAIVPLAGEFRAGVVRGAVHPGDGMFYVVGTDGWGNYALEDGSLERIRYTGKAFPMLENVHGHENGIELRFSARLSGDAVAAAESYFVQQWNYEYSPAYGSLEYSVRKPGREGHDRVRVRRAELLADGRSVFLEIPDLLPAMQTHVYAALQTEEGSLEVNTFATLVHLDKAKQGFAAPVPAGKSRTASLRVRGSKTDNERVARNVANTPEGRIRAGETLFRAYCTGCHGPQGQGLPNIAPTLHSDWVAGDRAVLAKVLIHGLTGEIKVNGKLQRFEAPMPPFGAALGDDEIAAILSFIRKSWTDADPDVTKELVQKVRAAEKGQAGFYEAKSLFP